MKLEFEQTIDHIRDLQKSYFFKNKWIKGFAIFIIVMILFNAYGMSIYAGEEFTIGTILKPLLPLVLIGGIWWILLRYNNKKMASGKNKDLLLGPRVIEFFEDKINYKTKILDTDFQWEAVTSFKESDLCYFLYTGTVQAILIPKSAFESEQQQKEFEDLIKGKINN